MNALHILHVEDSPDDAALIGRALKGARFTASFERVETEPDYLAQLDRRIPDVILCDYDLPQFTAERALALMRERGLDIPFIVVSNHIGQSDAVVAMQHGASDYLSKADLGRLAKAIESAVDRALARREKADAQAALRRSEATVRGILDSLLQRIALLDADGTVLATNKAWERFDSERVRIGLGPVGPGRNYIALMTAAGEAGDNIAAQLVQGIAEVRARRRNLFALEYELQLGSATRWYLARAFPLEGSEQGVVVSHADITDRMMSRVAIENAHQQLQELSKRVLHIQEEERRAISGELHDDIGQSLAALKIGLHRIARDPGADHAVLLAECIGTAESTIDKLRNVAVELRPPQLDQLGLAAALEWLAERQRAATGLRIECRCSGLEHRRPPPSLESACYRIAQESLNNATRHGNAKDIQVTVESDGQLLKLSVHDDGVGFDAQAARHGAVRSGSLGLIGMEERARLAGGRLKVRSVQGAGTTVSAVFPLAGAAEADRASSRAAA